VRIERAGVGVSVGSGRVRTERASVGVSVESGQRDEWVRNERAGVGVSVESGQSEWAQCGVSESVRGIG